MSLHDDDARWGYTVSRQLPWGTADAVVEVTRGGPDYTGSDQLVTRHYDLGEGRTFASCVEAFEAARAIAAAWAATRRSPPETVLVNIGDNGGGLFVLTDAVPHTDVAGVNALAERAAAIDAQLPRCAECGEILPKPSERWGNEQTRMDGEHPFCSERCAEKDAQRQSLERAEAEAEDEDEDDNDEEG